MRLFVIFGHRAERYEGQNAPEALDVIDEYGMDANPEWIHERLAHHRADKSFAAVEIIEVHGIFDAEIMNVLYPTRVVKASHAVAHEPPTLEAP